ncbi:NADH-quinone oxidoreductase subunit C [Solitalea canadensis]|uniref:NADH-quinone oxidoreductase subunit C n=1 Tax=Solitalea canadensis (strain ATCC 29591 / DSM 3403 / JCM 21819 / LMG 8368 / NBRC 15130 / NCIMB 12057 / USAM 9D) TaxID=929556 RepID=H8KME3_SOLCM|nr:NADH-quinone oxidoreductase subunit C [Solitalea canadensis]AFD08738.1 NADH/F420H2 dehydrogenase, subunit C [Solitalea canadensis DSM 3403]
MAEVTNQLILEKLQNKFADAIFDVSEPHDLLTVSTTKENILNVIQFLYNDEELKFRYLTDICGVHYPEQELALGVIYHLHSLTKNVRVRIKVFLPESAPRITTLTGLFLGANWMERETYDFYGIIFEGHPDLRRILNVDDMVAFPMRKEFPLEDPNRTDKNDDYFGR